MHFCLLVKERLPLVAQAVAGASPITAQKKHWQAQKNQEVRASGTTCFFALASTCA
jgi:hypothetical protein